MGTAASDREEEYRRQVESYLARVQIEKGWSQSELGRRGGIHASAINKAFHRKHSLGWDVIENLEEASGVQIPLSLRTAYRLRRVATEQADLARQVRDIPYMTRVIELTAQIHGEKNPARKEQLKAELQALIANVA